MSKYKHDRPTIGVLAGWQVYAGTLDTFLGPVYRGIRSAAHDLGCNLLLSCSVDLGTGREHRRSAWPIPLPNVDFIPVGPENVDGLIAVGQFKSGPQSVYLQQLIAGGYPLVFVGAGEHGPSVIADNEGGIAQAVTHLAEHGHRRIAFIAGYPGDVSGDSARRLAAYRTAVQECGLEVDENLIAYGSHSTGGGQQAMEHVLASGVPFTAVLASNDRSALGAMQALHNAGISVPQGVAVVGFDDRPEAAAHVPPLTTVRYPAFEEGYRGVMLLLDYIEGRAEGVQIVYIPTRLVIRESCGCLLGMPIVGASNSTVWQGVADVATDSEGIALCVEHCVTRMAQAVIANMDAQTYHLSQGEIEHLCRDLIEAFISSLKQGDNTVFHKGLQHALRRTMLLEEDPCAWQVAISILREHSPTLSVMLRPGEDLQVEDLLDQARIAITEAAHEQYVRHLIRQADMADQVGRMTARFLAARDEAEIFDALSQDSPRIGIKHSIVAFYEPEGDDPVAWSVLQTPSTLEEQKRRFLSRQFPPAGLYSTDQPFSLALLPLHVQEGVSGFVAFDSSNLEPCADIVRQLAVALREVRLYREAVEARQLAEEASRLKSRFLSVVSHELRTPLNLICGRTEILLRESQQIGPQECRVSRKDLERIYAGAQHLDGLIRDVLDLARSDVGQLKLLCEPLDLTEVLRAVSVIGEQLARDKELGWRAEIPDNLPQVLGDRTRLRQVVLNLVNNAVKFTARGEIALTAAAKGGNVIVMVRDTGLGIPKEEHEVIFDEFRQSERTTARGYGGLGLGLAICKRLVEMHGGTIGVHSSGAEGEGSTFYFTLPVVEHPAGYADVAEPPSGGRQAALLVKDVRSGGLLRERLATRGLDVVMYQVDGSANWLGQLLLTPPEVVVLDLGLTSEQGWEILKILKENPVTHEVPVLFCRLASDEDSGSLLEIDYLTKPVGTADLVEALMDQGLLGCGERVSAGRKVLIADDEPGVLEMHARIVEAQLPDCRMLRARNGLEALETIRQHRPDLVLLDLMMPELNGFGVLEAMREDELSRGIPVIVLTGQALTEEDMARLNRGVASVLQKGLFTVEETLERVMAALERKRKSASEPHRAVLKAMAYMHDHYPEPISRSDVATYVGLSERHLTRCFRQETGLTPIEYLNRYRVKRAKALLEAGDKSVTEVAMEVGFSTSGYFTRVFRQEVGMSPRAYQRGGSKRL